MQYMEWESEEFTYIYNSFFHVTKNNKKKNQILKQSKEISCFLFSIPLIFSIKQKGISDKNEPKQNIIHTFRWKKA